MKTYYQQNGRYPASWSNDNVKTWFTKAEVIYTNGAASASPTLQPDFSNTNKGDIAGGVVGGVIAFSLIGLPAFLLLRRRRRGSGSGS